MTTEPGANHADGSHTGLRFGSTLAFWVAVVLASHAVLWAAGLRDHTLRAAVDRGAARAESWGIGEVGDDVIRKAIRTQHETLPFWTTIAVLGDFAAEPLALVVRALGVAVIFSALAALTGRPIGFGPALAACAWTQGFWAAGIAVRAGLMVLLRRPEVETSATLLLPPGSYDATVWMALRQLDAFALLGWLALALGGWRRGQVNLLVASVVCGTLWAAEAIVRTSLALTVGAGMRLTLIPDTPA